MDKITDPQEELDVWAAAQVFRVKAREVQRPSGDVDLLIGIQEASFLNPLRCWIYGDPAALDKQRTSALGFKGSSILGLKRSSTGCRVLCYNFDGDKSLSKSDSSTQKEWNKLVLSAEMGKAEANKIKLG